MLRLCFCFFFLHAQVLRTKTYICKHIGFKQLMLRILEYQSHLAAVLLHIVAIRINILSVKINVTGSRLDQPVQMLHQCRLTGTGMSDHTHKFTVTNFNIYIFQGIYHQFGTLTIYIINFF